MAIDPTAQVPESVIGTPNQDVTEWDGQQSLQDDCAVVAQKFILEQFTGQKVDEMSLVQDAQQHGWYSPGGGTPFEDIGNLLEEHGVPVTHYEGANVFQLANELAEGHKVILAVDSGDLWGEKDPAMEKMLNESGQWTGDHAVVVSGIDTSDPSDVRVLVSDPGTGEALHSYPLNDFLAAWQGSDFTMVATQDPVPSSQPEMENFPYDQGHIDQVLGMPYEDFQGLADQPQTVDDLIHQGAPSSTHPTDFGDGSDPTASDPNAHDQPGLLFDPNMTDDHSIHGAAPDFGDPNQTADPTMHTTPPDHEDSSPTSADPFQTHDMSEPGSFTDPFQAQDPFAMPDDHLSMTEQALYEDTMQNLETEIQMEQEHLSELQMMHDALQGYHDPNAMGTPYDDDDD